MTSAYLRKFSKGSVAGLSLTLVGFLAVTSDGAVVTMNGLDAIGETSFNTGLHWTGGQAPSAGNDYVVGDGNRLRTPGDGNSYTFAGDSLTINNTTPYSEGLMYKGTGSTGVITIPNLILDGGLISHAQGTGDLFQLDGAVTVNSASRLYAKQGNIDILADISGTGNLSIAVTDAPAEDNRYVSFFGDNSGYSGSLDVAGRFRLEDVSGLMFDIGASGINNSVSGTGTAVFNGIFTFDLSGASSNPGDSWTIASVANQTFGTTFSVGGGFSASGSVWTDGTYTFNPASGILAVALPPIEWNIDADGNWSTGANWTGGSAPGTDEDALLGTIITENRTVTLDSNLQLNSLSFNNAGDGDYFIVPQTSQTLTLTGEARITAGGRHWMRTEVAGTVGLMVNGSGELVLDADNSFSGGLTVDGGQVSVVHTDAIPVGNSITLQNGGRLFIFGADNGFFFDNGSAGYGTGTIDGAVSVGAASTISVNDGATVTFSNVISGDGNVSLNNGTINFSTAHTYGGVTTLAGTSTLNLSGAATLGASDGTAASRTVINDTGQLVLNNVSLGNELLVLGERAVDARAHVSSTGSNTIAGNIKADIPGEGSHYILESTSGTLTLSGIISAWDEAAPNDRSYVFDGAGNFNITGQITDLETDADGAPLSPAISDGANVHVVKRGGGTMTIATGGTGAATDGDRFWRGTTTIEGGTLAVLDSQTADAGELFTSVIDVRGGAVFDTSAFSTYSLQVIEDPDLISFNGDEIGQTLSGTGTINTGAGKVQGFEDSVVSPGDAGTGVGTLTVTGNLGINQTQANPNGALNWDLGSSAAGTHDKLAVSGNLDLDADGAAGGGQFKLNVTVTGANLDTAAYTLMTAGSTAGSTATSADFDVAIFNPQGTQLNTRQDDAVAVTVGANSVTAQFSAAGSRTWTGAVNSTWDIGTTANWSAGDQLFFDLDSVTFGSATVDVASVVTPGGMTINNSANTTFTGAGIQGAGSVNVGTNASLTLANDGSDLSGAVTLGAGSTLKAGDGASTGTTILTGVVGGSGAVTVQSGTLQLSGDNTYTGVTTITGGVLNMDSATALGNTSAGTVVTGGSLRSNADIYTTLEPITLNGGSLSVGGGAAAALTVAGPVTIGATGGTIQVDGGTGVDGLTVTSNIGGAAGGAFNANIDGDSTMTVSGNITNNGVLNKNSGGVLALTGTATVSSPTININGGTLDVSALNGGAGYTVAGGQTLGGDATVLGNVSAGNGSTVRVGDAGLPQVDVYTYLDAKHGVNTTLADGSTFTPTTNPDWQERTGLANDGQLYQGGSDTANPNEAPVLKTTITGLTPGNSYNVYVNYWDATGSSWRILAGTSEGSLTLFDSPDDAVVDATDGANLNNLTYDTAPLITEGNRTMWGGSLGTLVANGSGEIEVFVDDTGTADGDDRTWYDGLTYSTGATTSVSQTFTIDGDLTLGAGSTLAMDISTTSVLDTLNIIGNLAAGGTLQVTLDGSAPAPQLGDQFNILDFGTFSGSFGSFSLPALGSGLAWDTANLFSSGGILEVINALLEGDLNGDGFVGLGDLDIVLGKWNQNVTPGSLIDGDPSGDGFVGLADLDTVLANWNKGTPPAANAVPEPASVALLSLGGMAMLRRRR